MKAIFTFYFIIILSVVGNSQTNFYRHGDNPIIPLGTPGEWDAGGIAFVHVLNMEGVYHMWYSGTAVFGSENRQIGHATSADGISWEKDANNPVLAVGSPGKFDGASAMMPWVIYNGTIYEMWYTGIGGGSTYSIGYASSRDGSNWDKYSGNPLIRKGGSGTFESDGVAVPVVIQTDSIFKMWYSGVSNEIWQTGYATSTDGIIWKKQEGNPVLTAGEPLQWDNKSAVAATVLYDEENKMYEMYYQGNNVLNNESVAIGYATSSDGISWDKLNDNPIMEPSGNEWESTNVWFPNVLKEEGHYKMWYSGRSSTNPYLDRLGYAVTDTLSSISELFQKKKQFSTNYPNPFHSKTTISYELPATGKVKLSVYDIFGREVEVLVNEKKNSAKHEVEWNAKGLPSGIYFYRLQLDNTTVSTNKMMLTR